MKKIFIVLILTMLISCQYFMPTSSIDNEFIEIKLNDSLYLVEDFSYSILKDNNQETNFVICDSVDSLFIDKNILLYRKNNYFTLKNDSIIKMKKAPKERLKPVETFFK